MSRSESVLEFQRSLRASRPGGVLVVAHRGTKAGVVAENTPESARIALMSGADAVEIDVTATTDGVALAHHDGTEATAFGSQRNVATLDAAAVAGMPVLIARVAGKPVFLPRLGDVVKVVADRPALVHIDRAWQWWTPTLAALDALAMPERIVLKTYAVPEQMGPIASHPVPYPVIAIVRSWDDVERASACEGLNLAGVEFIAHDRSSELAQPEAFRRAHDRGLSVLVNAEYLDGGRDLFAGMDDQGALFGDPDAHWGAMADLGADDIQTDFPWLLSAYLQRRAHAG